MNPSHSLRQERSLYAASTENLIPGPTGTAPTQVHRIMRKVNSFSKPVNREEPTALGLNAGT